jgi:hypothetical protein
MSGEYVSNDAVEQNEKSDGICYLNISRYKWLLAIIPPWAKLGGWLGTAIFGSHIRSEQYSALGAWR